MTENKLTLEDCFKYYKATIIYEQEKFFGIGDFFRCSNPTLNIPDCKLILRDIPQLTDEEKQYIVDKNFMHNIEVLFEYDINEIIRNTYSNKTIKLIDYFREIGIDIDGMFASGKAVKE